MNLLYDLTAIQPNEDGKYHGGGKYGKIVFVALIKYVQEKTNINIFVLIDKTKFLEQDVYQLIDLNSIQSIDSSANSIENIIDEYEIDRFYSALPYNFRGLEKIKCEIIGAIHGIRGLETNLSMHALLYERGAKRLKMAIKIIFAKIITQRQLSHFGKTLYLSNLKYYVVSNHTKFAIKSFFPKINIEKIKVFYSPDTTSENFDKTYTKSDYFLMVSGNRWMKNNLKAAMALDQIITDYPDFNRRVIITGITKTSIYLKHIKNINRFSLLGYVPEDHLANLYQNAYAFIYPTLNEGFGYPPLEAMKFGVPVITSAFTSVSEICGDAVLYVNPYSIIEIKNRILQLFYERRIYEELESKGLKRYAMIKEKQINDLNKLISFIIEPLAKYSV